MKKWKRRFLQTTQQAEALRTDRERMARHFREQAQRLEKMLAEHGVYCSCVPTQCDVTGRGDTFVRVVPGAPDTTKCRLHGPMP